MSLETIIIYKCKIYRLAKAQLKLRLGTNLNVHCDKGQIALFSRLTFCVFIRLRSEIYLFCYFVKYIFVRINNYMYFLYC